MHPRELYSAQARGELVSIARGVWVLPDASVPDPDLLAVTQRMPGVVFGGLTALVMHDLTDQIPRAIHVLLPHGRHPAKIAGLTLVGYHVAPHRLHDGVETRELGDYAIRVTDVARTIADAFKYRSRLGFTVARDALREALSQQTATPSEIMIAAQTAGVGSVVRPILEALA